MEVNKNNSPLSKEEIITELWRRGNLKYKLDANQKILYDLFYKSNHRVQTWLLARRSGKTWALVLIAIEQCIRKPNSIVKILSPTKLQCNNNLRPIFTKITEDCPREFKPDFRAKDYIYTFPNGSEIQLAGSDSGHAEKLRGSDSDICFVDEAGSCDDLSKIVKEILLPTTLITKGKIVLASTPPAAPEHDFLKFIEEAELRGSLVKKTVFDNPRLSKEQIDELITELGGLHTEAARRELLVELIKDPTISVIPDFTPDLEKEIIKEWPKPAKYDAYVSMDVGFNDLTVLLFGYYDFRAAKIVIEDEIVKHGHELHLPALSNEILEKEAKLWNNTYSGEVIPPYLRVSDTNLIVISELSKHSGGRCAFIATKKDDKEAAINNVRVMLANKKIIINPKCQTLIRHLRNVRWKSINNKSTFARTADDGHADAVDALIYFVRSVVFSRNPYPANYTITDPANTYFSNPDKFKTTNTQIDVYKKIFGTRNKPYGR